MISTVVTMCLVGSTVGSQDDNVRNLIQNDISYHNHPNQDYYVQQRPVLMPNYPQHYVPVPIQLLQRSVYTQQPQAALIIVKAFPVYLTPAQAASIQSQATSNHQDLTPRVPNVHMVHYSSLPATQAQPVSQQSYVYPTAQPAHDRPVAVTAVSPTPKQGNSYVATANPGLFFAPPSSNVQGDNYLNQLAQVVAQQYSKSSSNFKAPAIIAGLENFSAEQQNQIKNHLKNYITSHADGENQDKDNLEHREAEIPNDTQEKYSSKISSRQYSQQTDWRPAHQPVGANTKN